MGYVHIKNPQSPEKKNTTLQGWGMGLRFNLPEDLFVRLEVAYRIDRKATFDSAIGYMDIGKKF
jgi:hemolysin activation/secretion protein